MPFTFVVISSSRYAYSLSELTALTVGPFDTSLMPQATRLLASFCTGTSPAGSSSATTTIDRVERGLSHPVGILFEGGGGYKPAHLTGPSVAYQFGASDPLTKAVVESAPFWNSINAHLRAKENEVVDAFNADEEMNHTFKWTFEGEVNFNKTSEFDLWVALGKIKYSVQAEVVVNRSFLSITSVRLWGSAVDLYDFDYDSDVFLLGLWVLGRASELNYKLDSTRLVQGAWCLNLN